MTLHRYVLHDHVPDYLRLGWLALPTLEGTHHGFWSAHCVWLCGCTPTEPFPRAGAEPGRTPPEQITPWATPAARDAVSGPNSGFDSRDGGHTPLMDDDKKNGGKIMKPKNFPGRKNDRRKQALKEAVNFKRGDEVDILNSRILPDAVARGIRTKKDRSARGKFRP